MNESPFEEAARRLPVPMLTAEEKYAQLQAIWESIAETPDKAGGQRAHRGRRLAFIAAFCVGVVAVGVGTAAALGVFSAPPSDRRIAHCYTTADLNDPHNYEDFTVALPPDDKQPTLHDAAASALDICAGGWQQGRYSPTDPKVSLDPKPAPWDYPIPPLVACVLPSGEVGVFPGDAATCAKLGLVVAQL